VDSKRSYAFFIVPPIPLVGSVKINSGQNALIQTLLSNLVQEGMAKTILYPFLAAMNAKFFTMLPDVSSIRIVYTIN
jgi:hypothetical protein